MKIIDKLRLLSLILLLILLDNSHAQQTESEDVLDFLPAIIAASGGECDPSSLDALRANCTLPVSTDYDLGSRTINLPSGVKFDFNGGSIRNGTLVFRGGTIDGRLLNASLTIRGDVKLKDPVFTFTPSKWNVREGRVNKAQARANRVNINKAMDLIRRLGAHTMELGKMDAYFEVGWYRSNREEQRRVSIRIPSNFHFKMNSSTYLRVQPTEQPAYSLLNLYVTENSKVSGGHLAGDRYEHEYVPLGGKNLHEFGFGIYVIGSHNTVIENVDAYNMTGDGLIVHAETIRNPDGTLKPGTQTTENLLVKGGTFRDNRRNNISIVDADGVIFDGITVLRAGEGTSLPGGQESSAGVAPRYGMDLEANILVEDGTRNIINRITDITIRNSTFRLNVAGDIDVYTASEVLIEKNSFDGWVANFASNNVTVQDNVFESSGITNSAILIDSLISPVTGEELTYDWQILRNTIRGYQVGISVGSERMTVSDNELYDNVTGIQMQSLSDSTISNNIIESSLPVSYGHSPFFDAKNPTTIIKNVLISGEKIKVGHRPLNFRSVNASVANTSDIQLTIENSDLRSTSFWPVHVTDSKNILIRNSTYTNDIEVLNSENIILQNNELVP